jgi:hypothetical protein
MASPTFFQQFKENLFKGVFDFSSDASCSVTVALCAAASAPVATNSVLADLTTIAYTNLSSRVVTGITAEHTTGTVTLTANDLVLSASGGSVATFRYVVLFDDDPTSPADPLICFYDYGSNLTLADGESLTLDFGASGILTFS